MKTKKSHLYLASLLIGGASIIGGVSLSPPLAAASSRGESASSGCKLHVLGPASTAPATDTKWKTVFADFKSKYHCTVTATWESTFTTVPEIINEARLSHEPVDLVFGTGTETWSLASAGDLMNLNKVVASYKKNFKPGVLTPFTIDGQLWSVPYAPVSLSTFIYNKSLFKKLGLAVPHTFAQLEHVAKVIKQKTNELPIIEAGKTTWEWPMWYMAEFSQTSGNKSVAQTEAFLSGTRKFTASDSVAAFKNLAQFSSDGLLTESASLSTSASASIAAFVQGKAAMTFNGTWVLPTILAAKPDFQLGVFSFPRVVTSTGVVNQENGSPGAGVGIPAFITRADLPATEKLLKFISTPAMQNVIQSMYDPVIPTGVGVTPAKTALGTTLRAMLSSTVGWLDWIWPADVTTAVENAIEGVLFSHESPKSAAQAVQSEYETLKSQQHYGYNFWTSWTQAQKKAVEP